MFQKFMEHQIQYINLQPLRATQFSMERKKFGRLDHSNLRLKLKHRCKLPSASFQETFDVADSAQARLSILILWSPSPSFIAADRHSTWRTIALYQWVTTIRLNVPIKSNLQREESFRPKRQDLRPPWLKTRTILRHHLSKSIIRSRSAQNGLHPKSMSRSQAGTKNIFRRVKL